MDFVSEMRLCVVLFFLSGTVNAGFDYTRVNYFSMNFLWLVFSRLVSDWWPI